MSKSIKSFLSNINLIELDNWSVQYLFNTSFSYNDNYKLVKIGSFLRRNKTNIDILDNNSYKRVTIKINNGGIFLRDIKKGIDIGTKKQFLIKEGQFIVSKIDARNGAFGVIPIELDDAIITGNFWTFDVDYSLINPHFLSLITTTKEFILFCSNASNGTTNRHYLQEEAFLNVKIPLPSLEEQNILLKKYNDKILLAQTQEIEAKEIEDSIEEYLFKKLGIEKIESKVKNSKLQFIESKNIDRWDIWTSSNKYKTNLYNINFLKNIVTNKPLYGANEKGVKKVTDTRYIRITDINEDGSLNNEIVSPANVDEKFLLNENDFLIARSGNTVGKTFLYKSIIGRAIYAGYLVKYTLDITKVIPEYLLYFTKSLYYKNWIENNQRVSGQPNINGQEFLYSPIILPPLYIQETIVKEITKRKEKIKQLKQEAIKNRKNAIKEFEEEIFTK